MMKLRLSGWLFLGVTMALPAALAAAERTLRVVMLGSQSETLDYGRAQTYYPWVVTGNVCDVLVADRQGSPDYQLSRAITPNQDATRWTVSLRSGVRFSDGSPLTADDALASLRFLAASPGFAGFFSDVDMQASHVVNAEALELVLTRPRADLVTTVLTAASMVWKQGRGDAAIPVCSGPYQVTSFNAQNGALLSRNPYAWHPAAWFDRIEIRPLADATARVNALLSGAADYAFDIPVSSARSVDGRQGWQIIRSGVANASGYYFAMNTRVKPFDDVEVRQALKTLVNRQQLLDVVLGGYGYRGNDVFGQGLSGFDNQLPQRQTDAAEAQALLRKKGITQLTLLTADLTPGLNDAAELLRQQLADVGVTLRVETVAAADYLGDISRLHQAQMLSMYALNRPFLAAIPMLFGDDNPYNYGGWYPDDFAAGVEQARKTLDPQRQQQQLDQLQQQLWQQGPYLLWGYRDQLSAAVTALQGVELNQGIPLFRSARMAAGQ